MTGAALATVQRAPLRPGLAGLEQTIAAMTAKIREGARDPLVIEAARRAVQRVHPHDHLGEIQALWDYFLGLQGFPYRLDPVDVELVQAPPFRPAGGDCDCYTTQAGAYLEALGHEIQVVPVGTRAPRAGETPRFHHVYLRVRDRSRGRWLAFDPVLDRADGHTPARPGDELPHAVERSYTTMGATVDGQVIWEREIPVRRRPNRAAEKSFGWSSRGEYGANLDGFFEDIANFASKLDPTRADSPIRSALNAIPVLGPGIVAGADIVAGARKTIQQATGFDLAALPRAAITAMDKGLASGQAVKVTPPPEPVVQVAMAATMHAATPVAPPPGSSAPPQYEGRVEEGPKKEGMPGWAQALIAAGAVVGVGGGIYLAVRD